MEIIAEKREKLGKKTKQLRAQKKLPAVIFGKDLESIPLTIELNTFVKVFKKAGETNLIDLKFEGGSEKVLVKEVQVHPVTDVPIHVNFHKVDLTQTITAAIPVVVVGEEESPIIKSGKGLLLTLMNEIEVEALPSDLPNKFEVSVAHLVEIDAGVTVAELNYDRDKVEIVGVEPEDLVVKIDYAEMAEEEEKEVDEAALIEGVEASKETADTADEGNETEESAKKEKD